MFSLNVLISILILPSVFLFLLYKYMTRNFNYWEKKKVAYVRPIPFFGNFMDISLFRMTIGEFLAKLYDQMKNERFFGLFIYDSPIMVISSPELIKHVMVKDFNNFMDRCVACSPHDGISQHMLFIAKGPEWKTMRVKISPAFSSGKIKSMIPSMNAVGEAMNKYISTKHLHQSLEAKELCAKFSTDVVTQVAFGISAHSFDNEDADFRRIGRLMFDFSWSNAIQQTSYFFFPNLVKLFRFKFMDPAVANFMRDAFWNVIRQRENTNAKGNDVIDIIMELRRNKAFCEENNFVGDKVLGQAAQYFVAGFETTSATAAFTLYELCLAPEIQQKVRSEINNCLTEYNGFTMEALNNMKYLDMCISETLRKYPVLPFLDRKCKSDYKIPGTDVIIEKDTYVFIPVFGLHYDPNFWTNPETYDPERFSEKNVNKVTPFSYLPFGEGPRICIGARLGLVVSKLNLCHILTEYEVEKSADTPVPLVFERKTFVLASDVGLPMKFRKI